jgi:hypothetical protein
MERYTEKRRRLLKTIVTGGTTAAGFSALPAEWKKPVVNTILLPAHAQTSSATTTASPLGDAPAFIQAVSFAYNLSGADGTDGAISGNITPTNTPKTVVTPDPLNQYNTFQIIPTVQVDPSITDTFNLHINESVQGGDSTNFSPANQNLAPNNTTGVIPYVTINEGVDNAQYITFQITLTPDNPSYSTYYLEITFDQAPAGPP